jgi:Peroxidase
MFVLRRRHGSILGRYIIVSVSSFLLLLLASSAVLADQSSGTTAARRHDRRRSRLAVEEPVVTTAGHIMVGSQVSTSAERRTWWIGLSRQEQVKLERIYDPNWFFGSPMMTSKKRVAYLHLAAALYDFLQNNTSGVADAHADDFYRSYAPLLLRAAVHSAGTYYWPDGTGGSNGGSVFHHAELADERNGCMVVATRQLTALFGQHDTVSLADIVIIAGTVALDVLEFPRMDLVRVTGGREDYRTMEDHGGGGVGGGLVYRDRLPNPDDDPLELHTRHYGLTPSELTALIGGGHNFGAAHGKCSGYVGQWTATPLSWFGPKDRWTGTPLPPTFFTDLLRTDWRWYNVCTYYNDTVSYTSIADPFANGGVPSEDHAEEEEEHGSTFLGCPMMREHHEPLICEEQAMRGCDFADGIYGLGESPCDINHLQLRLKSDFFLKANAQLRPHADAFAADHEFWAAEFAVAYRKVMNLGLHRCGLSGHGCRPGTVCRAEPVPRSDGSTPVIGTTASHNSTGSTSKMCVLDDAYVENLINECCIDDEEEDNDDESY